MLLAGVSALSQEDATSPTGTEAGEEGFIELDRPLFLLEGPGGKLAPGFYRVRLAGPEQLEISQEEGETVSAPAYRVQHEQKEGVPAALLVEGDDGRADLVLVLDDGEAFAVTGSFTGVKSRADRLTYTATSTTLAAAYSRYPTLYYECPPTYRFRGSLDGITRTHGGSVWRSHHRGYLEGAFSGMNTGGTSSDSAYLLICNYSLDGSFLSYVTREPKGPSRDHYSCTTSNSTRRFTCTPK